MREARDVIVAAWAGAADPSHVLKRLYKLDDVGDFPFAYIRNELGKGDPNDDRVWLGRARPGRVVRSIRRSGSLARCLRAAPAR